jgi:hypothetical protein
LLNLCLQEFFEVRVFEILGFDYVPVVKEASGLELTKNLVTEGLADALDLLYVTTSRDDNHHL